MARRTLRLSKAGVDRARRTLKRMGLVQKDLTIDPCLASWGTINNFFNGRTVDHNIFKEICFHLNLDWQDVYEPEADVESDKASNPTADSSPQPSQASLLLAVQQSAIAAREALTPRILERIPREIVHSKYIPAIDRGVKEGQQRVIPIIGAAGYGKSTILGDLYDQLTQTETPWVGLILCSTLSSSVEVRSFVSYSVTSTVANTAGYSPTLPLSYQASIIENEFGKSLCGTSRSIVEVVEQLNQTHGRGVLLIDTLDLVINRDFTPAFAALLRQLLEKGATIVFTCRDHEYNDYLEPAHERLRGISQTIDRYSVPNFTTAEIRAAAETFFHKLKPDAPDRGQNFADNILSLSADNRPLRDIIENPLLLALLCDLFAQDDNVPPDLTVSKLYKRYWDEKIAYSRSDQSRFVPVAIEKENLCLTIARVLFEMSQIRLCESLYWDEVGIQSTEIITNAYSNLLSEGVLDRLPSGKVHFFHQTLLEYAIAYWLTRHAAQPQRDQLLFTLQDSEFSHQKTHWLPILRQYLVILDREEEFEAIVSQLNINDMGVFGAVALAAASRHQSVALLTLLPTALKLGEAHQRRLRQALESASYQLIEDCWEILLSLLEQAEHITAANTAQMLGLLFVRWWKRLKLRLPETLNAIANRSPQANRQVHQDKDDRSLLLGWLLQPCLPLLHEQPDPELLTTLQSHYAISGYKTCIAIIQLHCLPSVPPEVQRALLAQMLRFSVPNDSSLEKEVTVFLTAQLPTQLTQAEPLLGTSWMEMLYATFPKGWDTVQARAVGRWGTQNSDILAEILEDLCVGDPSRFRRNFIAIDEAIRQGGSNMVTQLLIKVTLQDLSPIHFTALIRFINSISSALASTDQEAITCWLQPFSNLHPELVSVFDALSDASATARQVASDLIEKLPIDQQVEYRVKQLRFVSVDQHPSLDTFDKPAQLWLARYYRSLASSDCSVIDRLLIASQSRYKEVAVAACHDLDKLSSSLTITQILPLLISRFPAVRASGLSVIKQMNNQSSETDPIDRTITPAILSEVCRVLSHEDNQVVARLLCELIAVWVRRTQQVPNRVAEAICGMTPRLIANNGFDGGIARSMIAALKAVSQTAALTLSSKLLSQETRNILSSINIIKVQNSESEMIDLMSAVHRLNQAFLPEVSRNECPKLVQRQWLRNIYAVVKTICRVEGQNSTLLDEILSSDWCTTEIRSIILEVRGV